MAERTRTIWQGQCTTCGQRELIPYTNEKILSVTRWCAACEKAIDCVKISYTGPELEPMVPSVHHVWCNGQTGPVKGCRWCCKQMPDGTWDGMWLHYPYDPAFGPPADFMEKHFPNVRKRC